MATETPAEVSLHTAQRVHLVGIGGSGMSALATLLVHQGKTVSGSDLSPDIKDLGLERLGINLSLGHRAEQIGQAELLVASAAVPPDNFELVEARRRRLPVITHAEALGQLMDSRTGVAVAGTHGKTTTTAVLGFILERCGLDPTVLVGAKMLDFDSSARLGRGRHLVVEADEYERRFLSLRPWLAVITSIEADHLDYFEDLQEIVQVFRQLASQVEPGGVLVTCADDPVLASTELPGRRVTYGFSGEARWRLESYQPLPYGGCQFELIGPSGRAGVTLRLVGRHNASNAAGAIAAACELGASLPDASQAAAAFEGTERRFQTVRRSGGIWLVDDYAHHPTAVRATLVAAREAHAGRLWAVFQPHTTNRLAELLGDFASSFQAADLLMLLPIYIPPGRERGGRGVSSHDLAAAIEHPPVRVAGSLEAAEDELIEELRRGDLALVMGAGDVCRVSRGVARRLEEREAKESGTRSQRPEVRNRESREPPGLGRFEPLGRYTSLKVGGPADCLAVARGADEATAVMRWAQEQRLACRWVGGGSNLLVADAGLEGVAARFTGAELQLPIGEAGLAVCGAGRLFSSLARGLAGAGWSGLEWAANVPGTVGGAVVNNAGAFESCVAECLAWAEIVRPDGTLEQLGTDELGYAYRTSFLKRAELGTVAVTRAAFRVGRTEPGKALARVREHQQRRNATQPRQHSAGSVFANPSGDYAGRLIEATGLKAHRVGGAQISAQHANFIVNRGGARASEVYQLVRLAQDAVWRQFGFWLRPEIELIGRWEPGELAALEGPG